jgi:cytochrome P450
MISTDPPRHRHLRSLVVKAFTQKRVAQLEPRIRAIAAQLLDEMARTDAPDLVTAFAYPFPVMVIGELLGVPAHESPQFRQWAIDFVGNDFELRRRTASAISAYFAAANLDPQKFPDPERFNIRRTPKRHLGFGFGIHLCLGASLARLEASVGLTELLKRFPRVRRDASRPLELRPSSFVYSLQSYPIHLQS